MSSHITFVAPFFMRTTLRFLKGTLNLPDVRVTLISQDSADRLPREIRGRLSGHWQVNNALDPEQLIVAVQGLAAKHGPCKRLFGPLEQLQVPLAEAREKLRIRGQSSESAMNFRDKARMKTVLTAGGVMVARHSLVGSAAEAEAFVAKTGFPVVVKPPAGAGGKGTFRLESVRDLQTFLTRHPLDPRQPTLFEEFVTGIEHSFDSVVVGGRPVWYSISRYMPSPLQVLENPWIQWCVLLPRDVSGPEFNQIRDAAFRGVRVLGLETGLTHMEWFALKNGRIAISEVGARPPGAQFTTLLSYAHDLDFYSAWPKLMVYETFDPPPRHYAVGASYFRGQGRGRVKAIHGLDEAQRRFGHLVVEAHLPRQNQPPSDSYEGDGYVIMRHERTDVVEEALQEIVKMVRVELG